MWLLKYKIKFFAIFGFNMVQSEQVRAALFDPVKEYFLFNEDEQEIPSKLIIAFQLTLRTELCLCNLTLDWLVISLIYAPAL